MSKTAKDYMALYRQRKKDRGLVKREVWIKPQHSDTLKDIEKLLQNNILPQISYGGLKIMNIETLKDQLLEHVGTSISSATLLSDQENTMVVTMDDYEEFPVFVSIPGKRILVSTVLFDVNDVDPRRSNELHQKMLGLNPILSLSAFGIMGNNYVLYGELSANSDVSEIITELFTLVQNVEEALTFVSELLSE